MQSTTRFCAKQARLYELKGSSRLVVVLCKQRGGSKRSEKTVDQSFCAERNCYRIQRKQSILVMCEQREAVRGQKKEYAFKVLNILSPWFRNGAFKDLVSTERFVIWKLVSIFHQHLV